MSREKTINIRTKLICLIFSFVEPTEEEKIFAPKFIEQLQPVHTADGYTVQLECKVEGSPRPQITWFRQTAIIKPSQDFQMYYDDDNVATLVIREVFPEDAGTFTCVAKNAAGFASSSTELTVENPLSDKDSDGTALSRRSLSRESSLADILEGIPPTFSKKPRAQCVDENSNVILECRLVAVPEPDIVWLFNGEEIKPQKNVKIATESDMHMYCSVLQITTVQRAQEGIYEVVATNREGEARLPIQLKVRTGDKEAPQVLEPLRNLIIREGESVVLSTQIVGNPTPKITWLKNGEPLQGVGKSDKDTHTLTLISPNKDQSGEYTVKAVNSVGSVETSATLTVEGMYTENIDRIAWSKYFHPFIVSTESAGGNAEPPFFVERFEEQRIPQNSTIKLPAKVSGNPVPEITWFHNNVPLQPSDRVKQSYDGENIELTITKANSQSDSGDYKCVASNSIGKASHGARVIVEVEDVVFTKKLKKKVSIQESQTLTLECETSHYVTTKWYHNGKELTGMDHRVVVQEDKIHKLIIRNTVLRDAGKYECRIKNLSTDSNVDVLEKTPEFVRTLEDLEVQENEVTHLEVEISSDNADVVWIRDTQPLSENEDIQFVKEGKIRKMIIKKTTIHNEGEYTCRLGEQECSAELTVIELPPKIVTPLENLTVAKGEKANFEIELTKGDALVRWFHGKRELVLSDNVQLTIDGKRQKLKILRSDTEDAGSYSCIVGKDTCTARLTVEEPAVEFIVPLPEVTLGTKTKDVEFVVKLSQPDVDVTWTKKGKPITPSSKYSIDVEGTVRKFVIHNADDNDIDEYICQADNVKSTSILKLEDIKTPPKIIIDDADRVYKVREGEDVTFNVKLSGTPAPDVEWSTSGTVVKPSARTKPTFDEKSASLTIKKVSDEDVGEYIIKVKNPSGEADAFLTLIILSKFELPFLFANLCC